MYAQHDNGRDKAGLVCTEAERIVTCTSVQVGGESMLQLLSLAKLHVSVSWAPAQNYSDTTLGPTTSLLTPHLTLSLSSPSPYSHPIPSLSPPPPHSHLHPLTLNPTPLTHPHPLTHSHTPHSHPHTPHSHPHIPHSHPHTLILTLPLTHHQQRAALHHCPLAPQKHSTDEVSYPRNSWPVLHEQD